MTAADNLAESNRRFTVSTTSPSVMFLTIRSLSSMVRNSPRCSICSAIRTTRFSGLSAPRYMPPVFKQLNEMLCLNDAADDGLFVISNEYFAGGAAAVFYPGFLDSIGMALNKDLFILPSSINEMILVTDNGQDPGALLQIVKEVNRYHVAPEDVLTDAVYHYSRGDGGFHKLLPVTA